MPWECQRRDGRYVQAVTPAKRKAQSAVAGLLEPNGARKAGCYKAAERLTRKLAANAAAGSGDKRGFALRRIRLVHGKPPSVIKSLMHRCML